MSDRPAAASERKIRWGILGCARIAEWGILPAIKQAAHAELYALASRSKAKADEWAAKHGAPVAYGTYEELLRDPAVEAIYIPLPNGLHAEWTAKAAKAKKPVLCEKPLAANAGEAKKMVQACRKAGVLLFEAFMYRFHPRTALILEVLRKNRIGKVQSLRGAFSFQCKNEDDIRLDADLAGGALMDVGCYCVNIGRLVTGAEPVLAMAYMQFKPGTADAKHPVDIATFATLEYPDGVMQQFTSRLDSAHDGQWLEIIGTEGRLRVERPFTSWGDNLTIQVNNETLAVPSAQHYALELDAVSVAIREGKPVAGLTADPADGVRNMTVIDALYKSAKTGRRVKVEQ